LDYYKLIFPAGYNYSLTARINDNISSDDLLPYTIDAVWSYSSDGGFTWSPEYDNTMPGVINITGGAGGTIIFSCGPKTYGITGTYLLKIPKITRVSTASVINMADVDLSAAKIYPNPASGYLNIDLSGANTKITGATLSDIQGKKVFSSDNNNDALLSIPVDNYTPGIYFLSISTEAGIINKKVTISK
jgi:hypothetical protein